MKPRKRYFSAVSTGLALLFVLGGSLHYAANRVQRSGLERRLDKLEADIASMQKRSAVERLSVEGNEPRRGESVEGYRSTPVGRPRFLGHGQNGRWIYLDVRHVDGQVCRYYIRRDPTREQVREFVATLVADCRDRASVFSAEN